MIAELKQTKDYLKDKGIQSPAAEAEHIFCHFLNCEKIDLYTSDISFNEFQRQDIYELIERRASGEPLQYILEKTEFYGFEFKIRKGVFIPRPETEILVNAVLSHLTEHRTPNTEHRNILDLCTGTGNIAISLTKTLPHYKMFISDIAPGAVSLAKENAVLNNVSNAIEFRCGDLFSPWHNKRTFFDIIACNPPYVRKEELENLPLNVRNEPQEALDGGIDGLDFYRRIIKEAPLYMKDKGYLFFELNPETADDVKDILVKDFTDIEIIKDYTNKERVVYAQLKERLMLGERLISQSPVNQLPINQHNG